MLQKFYHYCSNRYGKILSGFNFQRVPVILAGFISVAQCVPSYRGTPGIYTAAMLKLFVTGDGIIQMFTTYRIYLTD